MIKTDETALICDLAETYGIYEYRSLPASKVAAFSVGLRDESRIKMLMNKHKYPLNTILMASILDSLKMLSWSFVGSANGEERPESLTAILLGIEQENEKENNGFNSPEDFERARNEILESGGE